MNEFQKDLMRNLTLTAFREAYAGEIRHLFYDMIREKKSGEKDWTVIVAEFDNGVLAAQNGLAVAENYYERHHR